ncbi:MAG: hypothetical protein QGH15_02695 [Kiritimatiellia bacterium]|jgi:hypothetical protein|nr:hypothetical protein [Kiritimatiellia bacterium]
MSTLAQLRHRRVELLEELADLQYVRRGSVVEQVVQATAADGRRYQRGPYPVYSFKEKGRTISRRLHSAEEINLYRQQIQDGRRFQKVVNELLKVSEALSDTTARTLTVKKTPHTRSKRTRKSVSG